jgi:hypothetical protein
VGNANATNHPGSLQETLEDERVWAFEAHCWQHFQKVSTIDIKFYDILTEI